MGRSLPSVLLVLVLATAAGCTDGGTPEPEASPPPTASAPSASSAPPSGRLDAELLQYSRDAARGRMQVWLDNDTAADLEPTRIVYDDPRLSRPILGQRLRTHPSGTRRGYPLPLPEPRCGRVPDRAPVLIVRTTTGRRQVPVADPVDVVGQYVAARCFERAARRLVDLRWADPVPSRDGVGTLTLVATPTGRTPVEIVRVGGTPVFAPAPGVSWRLDARVDPSGPPRRFALPVVPARCDSHAFLEAGGATAFRVRLRFGGRSGEFVLRMSPEGGRAAIDYGLETCFG